MAGREMQDTAILHFFLLSRWMIPMTPNTIPKLPWIREVSTKDSTINLFRSTITTNNPIASKMTDIIHRAIRPVFDSLM